MGATLVQKAGAQSASNVSSQAFTLPAPPTPGNLVLVGANSDATLTGPAGFLLAVSAVSNQGLYLWYRVAQAGDSATATVVPTVSDSVAGGILEYSGLTASPLDQVASNTTTLPASSLFTGATAATSQADELIIVVVGPHAGNNHPWSLVSWSTGYASQIEEPEGLATVGSSSCACHIGDQIVSTIVTASATGTWSPASSDAGAVIATFKIAAGGHTVSVGRADETDTAQPIRPLRIKAVGQAFETDMAAAIRPAHIVQIGQASEADSAGALGRLKLKAIGRASESDTAVAIGAGTSSALRFDFLATGRAQTGWQAGHARTLEA